MEVTWWLLSFLNLCSSSGCLQHASLSGHLGPAASSSSLVGRFSSLHPLLHTLLHTVRTIFIFFPNWPTALCRQLLL